MITPDTLVSREVHYCVSYLVSTLASGYGAGIPGEPGDLADMIEQAFDLASGTEDWEEALIENGWERVNGANWRHMGDDGRGEPLSMQEAIDEAGIEEPHYWEVFEHWIVSEWLADKLEAHGEKVDKDFAGMVVWARTTSGQGIASDSVIEAICAELNAA